MLDYLSDVDQSGPTQIVSFTDFHSEYYYEDYSYFFCKLLNDNRLPLGKLERYRDSLIIDGLSFKKIRFKRISYDMFEFYPVIEVFFNIMTGDSYVTRSEWYEVPGKFSVNGGIWLFQNLTVYDYKKAPSNNMTEHLVPIMDNYDNEAEHILKVYQNEVLQKPMCVDVEALAKSIGYVIRYEHLSKSGEIEGKIAVKGAEVTVFDNIGRPHEITISCNTIFIDKSACRKHGRDVRNAIAHECVQE